MSRSFADRFPTAARLLGLADSEAAEEGDGQEGGGEGSGGGEGDGAEGSGDGAGGDGEGTVSEGREGSGGEGEGDGGGGEGGSGSGDAGASAIAGVLSASGPTEAQLMTAFEADAARLVAAERARCIAVFTSDAGRRNVAGAAILVGDPDMDALSAPKIIKFLGTTGGSGRSLARDLLRDNADTRVDTGAATDAAAAATDAKTKHRDRQKARNPKHGKRVNAAPGEETPTA